jgi:hypothetical protein
MQVGNVGIDGVSYMECTFFKIASKKEKAKIGIDERHDSEKKEKSIKNDDQPKDLIGFYK